MKKTRLLVLAIVIAGCAASVSQLSKISIGMDKGQVKTAIGEPAEVREANKLKDGGGVKEIWQYNLREANKNKSTIYWLQFINDTLVKWGKPGDFEKQPDVKIDVKHHM